MREEILCVSNLLRLQESANKTVVLRYKGLDLQSLFKIHYDRSYISAEDQDKEQVVTSLVTVPWEQIDLSGL